MSSRRDKNRKIRRLKSRLAYYRSTLSEMREVQEEYESEWARDSQAAINNFCTKTETKSINAPSKVKTINLQEDSKNSESRNSDKDSDLVENNETLEVPKWAKDLFRKIARRTHPDVSESPEFVEYFRNATESMESQKYSNLIDIALDLGLDPGLNQSEMILKLERRLEKLKIQIDEAEKSFSWLWGESYGIDEIRINILKGFLLSKNIKFKEEDVLQFVSSLSDS